MIPRFHILGSPVDAMNMETCCASVEQALDSKTKGYVCVAGVHQLT